MQKIKSITAIASKGTKNTFWESHCHAVTPKSKISHYLEGLKHHFWSKKVKNDFFWRFSKSILGAETFWLLQNALDKMKNFRNTFHTCWRENDFYFLEKSTFARNPTDPGGGIPNLVPCLFWFLDGKTILNKVSGG